MMIKLSDGCFINSDHIAEIKVLPDSGTITVRTKDGIGHHLTPGYGEGIYAACDKLIAQINGANKD